jgi:hypothetical protein
MYLFSVVDWAISPIVPAFAQGQNAVDSEVRRQIEAALMKFDEAFDASQEPWS